jgi:hypothetical protein
MLSKDIRRGARTRNMQFLKGFAASADFAVALDAACA